MDDDGSSVRGAHDSIAAVALTLGRFVPVVGAPVIAVVISMLGGRRRTLEPGIGFAKTTILQFAVVVLGLQLSLGQVVSVGVSSLPVMLGTLTVCLLAAWLIGRWLGIDSILRTLIGVGTGICGASAIAATSPVVRARSEQIAYAISTIFFFNVLAVLVFPPLGHALGMNAQDFGLFAGTAVNDTSSVVAAANVFGHGATDHAVVVKLVRTLMIIPIVLFLAARFRKPDAVAPTGRARVLQTVRLVPWFLGGFLLAAGLQSSGIVPAGWHDGISQIASALIAVALAAIGLSTDVNALRRAGAKPLLLGLILWIAVGTTSLGLQAL